MLTQLITIVPITMKTKVLPRRLEKEGVMTSSRNLKHPAIMITNKESFTILSIVERKESYGRMEIRYISIAKVSRLALIIWTDGLDWNKTNIEAYTALLK